MVICENAGDQCLNSEDNPNADDATTTCKQLQRTQKLLAVDEKGYCTINFY